MNGQRAVVVYLVEEQYMSPTDERGAGWTPLAAASNFEQMDVIQYLLSRLDDFPFLDQSGDLAIALGRYIYLPPSFLCFEWYLMLPPFPN